MSRPLKSFTTTAGFFDLAVAAPSMKAALEAWGAGANLFHQGFARESHDVDVVTATMAKPGVVLRRPVGTNDDFTEDAEVSGSFVGRPKHKSPARKPSAAPPRSADRVADRQAALAYEKQEAQRERQKRKEEAAQQRARERRDQAIAGAEAALQQAEEGHSRTVQQMDKLQAELDRKSGAEKARWEKEKERLQDALREARSLRHLKLV